MFKLSVADLDSPSYFVATAAVELGFFREEGVDVELIREYGGPVGPERLRAGELDFYGGPAYAATRAFPDWKGTRLLCALAQYSYWFLAVRADLGAARGDLAALKGLRISSSMEAPVHGLRHLLAESGFDLARGDVTIVPAPPTHAGRFMGHAGVEAIKQGLADAYWGNGMRLALGEQLGIAKLHLDLRRGDGPPGARFYNFAALATTDKLIEQHPDAAAGAVRAIAKAQTALKANPALATGIAERLFPAEEVPLIAGLIARDAPFYDATISAEAIDGLSRFAKARGLIAAPVAYEDLVAGQLRALWKGATRA
jgi:ABC-type nitrate/sulfonate/bicarbonate transport system substrate-binding protein